MSTVRIQLRRGLASEWTSVNPTLAAGEVGIETDTNTLKFGDGSTAWNDLSYALSNTVDDYQPISEKGQAGGYASLDGSGLIPVSQLPPTAKITVNAVADQAARLALTVEPGDIAIQSDNGTTYVLSSSPATSNNNWKEISATAAISAAVSAHEADTTNVHGIADTAALATKTYADGKASDAQSAATSAASSALSAHESDTTNIHGITDTSVLVTLDANQTLTAKTLSSATLTGTPTAPTASVGTDNTQIATTAFVQDAIELVVGAAPAALNTLSEIATSLNNDADLAGTLTTSIATKVAKSGDTMSGVLNMGTNKITSLGTATTDYDAANKLYVDSRVLDAVAVHGGKTTNVHGILDTADLVYTSDSRLSDERTPSNLSVANGKIQDDAVTTTKIIDSAVTSAKIAANAVLASHIADGTVGTPELADLAVTTAKIDDASVTSAKIIDSAVTSAKIAANAVLASHIADGAVGTSEVDDLAITTAKIAALSIIEGKIADDAVTTAKIADLNVTTVKIADDAVTTAKIADLNVTEAKINSAAVTEGKIGAGAVSNGKIADGAVSTAKIADSAITSAKIEDGTIVNGDISATAAIAQSKISGLTTDLAAKLASATAATTYAPIASPTFTGTVSGITKSMVGLADVDNTSDAAKPVSTATQTALDLKAPLAAPTFTGTVVLPSTTSIGNVSATEIGYVDGVTSAIQTQIDSKLSKSGGTMTGDLVLAGAPTADLHAATKAYVDNISAGLNFHQPVRVATTANITLSGTQTVDGVALAVGDRVLVKDQTTQTQNGIYVVASGAWTRAVDADNNPTGELAGGDFCLVLEGTVGSGYGYVCSNTSAITIGTTNVTYTAFNAAKAVVAGSGLTESTPGTIDIATGGVTSAMIADGTIVNADINASAAIDQSKINGLATTFQSKLSLSGGTMTGAITLASGGLIFSDGTQTKEGVVSRTPILTAVSANTTLDALGTDAAVRDSLVPVSGAYAINFEATGNAKFAIGSSISFYQSAGTGASITGTGVTILATPGATFRTTYSSVTATKVAASTWLLAGDLKA